MKTEGRANDATYVAEGKTLDQLRPFLCDLARTPGRTEIKVDVCRRCLNCNYGAEYVKRYDAGERLTRLVKRCKRHTEEVESQMDETKMMKLEKDLADAQAELEQLRSANAEMAPSLEQAEALNRKQEKELHAVRMENVDLKDQLTNTQQLYEDTLAALTAVTEAQTARAEELETVKQALRQSEERRKADELLMVRIKARMWDMEHSDF